MNESIIFKAAVKLPKEQRPEFLDAACAGNPQLRAEVECLLQEHDGAGSFLSRPAANPPATDLFRPITEGPGTIIGPYKLLQQIGEGGFGVVYMAEQQRPVRRKVALKIIKPGMDTREVTARFESERQALALMDHPNIARVLDAGATESGRPYFVMELVKGVPITEYCDKNTLPTEKRLELFITICHAVQHAHQKGVIHRDIKPSNVMVTLHDGHPVPKVIDFGVSKATSQQLTEKTLFTAYGQMIGTPAYMSPEQAEMSGLDIDTRSDLYSLGVLLYELLTGTTPFDGKRLREAGYIEMQRIIREEAPPRPSTRVSTLGEALTILSTQRSTDPKKLGQQLRGDLDVIVMKALEKERNRRYDTPNAFADDIQRFLNHEAIVARPASTAYRLKKFVQRNVAAVAAITAIAVALLAGTSISTWLAIRESQASRLAQSERAKAEKNLIEAVTAKSDAQRERDLAEKAKAEESRQRQLAEEQETAAKAARMAEVEQRAAAERERDDATKQRDRATALNKELQRQKEQQRRMLYAAQMNLIQTAWNDDNVPHVKELLNSTRPRPGEADLRGIEWHYWQRMLHQEDQSHRLPVDLLALSNPTSGFRSSGGGSPPSFVTRWLRFSSDGTRMAAISANGENPDAGFLLRVWNTAAGHNEPILTHPLANTSPVVRRPGTSIPALLGAGVEVSFLDAHKVVVGRRKSAIRTGPGSVQPVTPLGSQPASTEMELFSISLAVKPGGSPSAPSSFTIRSPFVFSQDGTRLATVAPAPSDADPPGETKILILDGITGATLDEYRSPFLDPALHALSDDGKRLVLSDLTQRRNNVMENSAAPPSIEVLIVNLESRQSTPLQPLKKSPNSVGVFGTLTFEFSPNLAYLAVARSPSQSWPTTLLLFETATGREVPISNNLTPSLAASRYGRNVLAFSPDSQWLVTNVTNDTDLRKLALCHIATGKQVLEYKGHAAPPVLAAFSANGKQLFSTDADGVVKVWRVPESVPEQSPSLEQIRSRSPGFSTSRTTVTSSPDGRWTASAPQSADAGGFISTTALPPAPPYELQLTDRDLRDAPLRVVALCGPVRSLVFSPDSSLLAILAIDPAAKLEEAAELQILSVATGQRLPLAFPRFAVRLFDSSRSSRVSPSTAIRTFLGSDPVFSPDSQRLTIRGAASVDGKPQPVVSHLWDLRERRAAKVAKTAQQPGERIDSPYEGSFSPDGKLLLLSVRLRAALAREPVQRVAGFARPGPGLQVNDAATGALLWEQTTPVLDAVFSGDSHALVGLLVQTVEGGEQAFTVVNWQANTGQEKSRFELPLRQGYSFLTISTDGSKVAVRHQSARHVVYESASGKLLYTLTDPANNSNVAPDIAFTPDGGRLLNVPSDSRSMIRTPFTSAFRELTEAKIWDAHTGQELLSITPESPLFAEFKEGRAAGGLTPLPPAIEAEELAHWLDAPDESGQPPTLAEVIQRLQTETAVSEKARQLAIQAVRQRRNPAELMSLAAKLLNAESPSRQPYERALALILEAQELSREHGSPFMEAWAHYRLGDWAAAAKSLSLSTDRLAEQGFSSSAEILVLSALVQHHLGEREKALQSLAQSQVTASISEAMWRRFLPEAEKALGIPQAADQPEMWIGRRFMPRSTPRVTDANGRTTTSVSLPYLVTRVEGDRLWIGKNSIARNEVVPLEKAPSYYTVVLKSIGLPSISPELVRASTGLTKRELHNLCGIAWRAIGETDQAIANYEAGIELQPTSAAYRGNLARLYALDLKQYDRALAGYNEAIRLSPNNAPYHEQRGFVLRKQGQLDAALQNFDEAIRLDPNLGYAYCARAYVWSAKGDRDKMFQDLDEGILRTPDNESAWGLRAWLLATSQVPEHRDGPLAIAAATKACEISFWTNARSLETLAAAHAESGNFAEAIKWQVKAIEYANKIERPDLQSRLSLYRENKPYREPPTFQPTTPTQP